MNGWAIVGDQCGHPGDVAPNPFRNCGTTIDATGRLSRDGIGIDVIQLAISLIRNRRQDTGRPDREVHRPDGPNAATSDLELRRMDRPRLLPDRRRAAGSGMRPPQAQHPL